MIGLNALTRRWINRISRNRQKNHPYPLSSGDRVPTRRSQTHGFVSISGSIPIPRSSTIISSVEAVGILDRIIYNIYIYMYIVLLSSKLVCADDDLAYPQKTRPRINCRDSRYIANASRSNAART